MGTDILTFGIGRFAIYGYIKLLSKKRKLLYSCRAAVIGGPRRPNISDVRVAHRMAASAPAFLSGVRAGVRVIGSRGRRHPPGRAPERAVRHPIVATVRHART